MRISANRISFNIQIDGPDGAPWLVLSNSLLTNLTMWDDQVAALKSDFRVSALRPARSRRHRSERREIQLRPPGRGRDRVARCICRSRAHFAGLSMGGMTALFLAQRHPGRFDRIIAADCGPASTPAGAQQWSERITLAAEKGMAALADITIPRWFPPASSPPGAGTRKSAGHDRRDAIQGLRRLRPGAVGL